MFNVGGGELLMIAIVALVVLGPQRLPAAMRKLGELTGELRRLSGGFQADLRSALEEAEREAEDARRKADEARRQADAAAHRADAAKAELEAARAELKDTASGGPNGGPNGAADHRDPDGPDGSAPPTGGTQRPADLPPPVAAVDPDQVVAPDTDQSAAS